MVRVAPLTTVARGLANVARQAAQRTATVPVYHTEQTANSGSSAVTSCTPLSAAPASVQPLFATAADTTNGGDDGQFLVTTAATVFHPQGGGQPTDTGEMLAASDGDGSNAPRFSVTRVRHHPDPDHAGEILHCGRFTSEASAGEAAPPPQFAADAPVTQRINARRRALHSRIHTGGHVMSLAVRQLAARGELQVVSDLRASHFPDVAFVEFGGRIEGAAKAMIQRETDALIERDLAILVHSWSPEEARERCTSVPGGTTKGGDVVRVVEVDGVGSYPCGGTHLPRIGDVGRVVVRNIKRSKGTTTVSYRIANTERTREWDEKMAREDAAWMPEEQRRETDEFIKAYFKEESK